MPRRPWFPRNTPASVAANAAAAQQATLNEIAQSTDATEQILLNPTPLPLGGATEATQQLNQQALGTEGGGVTIPPPGGSTGILGWIRSLREFWESLRSVVSGQSAIRVDVVQTVGGGGGGGGDASAANQVTEIARLTSILAKIITAPSTEAKQDAEIAAINAITAALGGSLTISLPAGISTEAKQDVIITGLASIYTLLGATLTVSGTVNVGNFPGTQPVSGTFWQATQPISAAALPLPAGASTETTLLAILAKLIASPATEAKQDALIALLPSSLTALSNFKVAIQEALPAGTNEIGKTFLSHQITKALTNAAISISSSGDNTGVAGTAAQTVRVFRIVLVAASAVSVKFRDNTTDLTGAMPLTANGTMVLESETSEPLFVTTASNAFNINLSSAVSVTGFIQYTKS